MNKSGLTAIRRKGPSVPLRRLMAKGLIGGCVLDYGSGHGADAWAMVEAGINVLTFDPNHQPRMPLGPFDVITCTYVLNVLKAEERAAVLSDIKARLAPGGVAYISVRRDIKRQGLTRRGTWQETVKLDLPLLEERKGSHAIYILRKQAHNVRAK